MTALLVALVRTGIGPVSYLEMWWLLVSTVCLKDAGCALLDARRQMRIAAAPPVDEVERLLALVDWRAAWQGVAVQVCFLTIGLIAAVREAPQIPSEDAAAASVATILLLVGIQLAHLVGARARHRVLRKIDAALRDKRRSSE